MSPPLLAVRLNGEVTKSAPPRTEPGYVEEASSGAVGEPDVSFMGQ